METGRPNGLNDNFTVAMLFKICVYSAKGEELHLQQLV